MSVVFDRPYEFIPPHQGNWWPNFIQTFRIYDWHLKRKDGVVGYRCEGLDHWRRSLERKDGILVAPNHCRYADPLVLGWPARQLGTHLHALASWHLFNESPLMSFAIHKMGAYTLHREGSDRRSLDVSIEILATGSRPLIVFPEGATYRTNDVLKPLLDGTTFIARAAARRAAKNDRRVVILPIALKYLCKDPVRPWAEEQLGRLESHLQWRHVGGGNFRERCIRLVHAMFSLVESRQGFTAGHDRWNLRRDEVIEKLLRKAEAELALEAVGDTGSRVRSIRTAVSESYFGKTPVSDARGRRLKEIAEWGEQALELNAFVDLYLQEGELTESRLVETVQRLQDRLLGKADQSIRLEAVIRVDEPFEVPATKGPRGETDPLLVRLEERLTEMLADLSAQSPVLE